MADFSYLVAILNTILILGSASLLDARSYTVNTKQLQDHLNSIVPAAWKPLRESSSVTVNAKDIDNYGWNWNVTENQSYSDTSGSSQGQLYGKSVEPSPVIRWDQYQVDPMNTSDSSTATIPTFGGDNNDNRYQTPTKIYHIYYPRPRPHRKVGTASVDRLGSKLLDPLGATSLVKIIFVGLVIKLFIGLFILVSLAATGIKFGPIVLPLFLIPIVIVAFLVFIPIFLLALVVLGVIGDGDELWDARRRKGQRRSHQSSLLQRNIEEIFNQLPQSMK